MKSIWYIYTNQVVSGPFSTEKVREGLSSKKWTLSCMIWWKGQREWISIETWKAKYTEIMENIRPTFQKSVWYVEHLGQQKGPYNSDELIKFVQESGSINTCRIWTSGLNRWVSVFEVPELVDSFNISRRKYPRAPIKGSVVIKRDNLVIDSEAHTISEGGIGFKANPTLSKGDKINVTIKSPMLVHPLSSSGQVVYSFENGVGGIEFRMLQAEAQSTITSYVKQFKI